MRTIFFILLTLSQSVYANTDVPTYVVTSTCVVTIDTSNSASNTGWTVIINLTDVAAESLLIFSTVNLKKRIRFIDGKGNKISSRDVMLQTPVSKSIHLTGLKTQLEAQTAKNNILSTKGLCGDK
jgi:hypothetical protein